MTSPDHGHLSVYKVQKNLISLFSGKRFPYKIKDYSNWKNFRKKSQGKTKKDKIKALSRRGRKKVSEESRAGAMEPVTTTKTGNIPDRASQCVKSQAPADITQNSEHLLRRNDSDNIHTSY